MGTWERSTAAGGSGRTDLSAQSRAGRSGQGEWSREVTGRRSELVGGTLNVRRGEEPGMSPEVLDQAEWTCYLQTW